LDPGEPNQPSSRSQPAAHLANSRTGTQLTPLLADMWTPPVITATTPLSPPPSNVAGVIPPGVTDALTSHQCRPYKAPLTPLSPLPPLSADDAARPSKSLAEVRHCCRHLRSISLPPVTSSTPPSPRHLPSTWRISLTLFVPFFAAKRAPR
jgi:hypothetical protein